MKKVKTPFDYMSSSPDRYALLKAYARENRQKMTLAEVYSVRVISLLFMV